jgi:hypothetical protein
LTWWGFWLFLMATATLVLSSIMAIITWVLMVKTNELPFISIHVFWGYGDSQTFNQPPYGPFGIWICFHEELMFSFCEG